MRKSSDASGFGLSGLRPSVPDTFRRAADGTNAVIRHYPIASGGDAAALAVAALRTFAVSFAGSFGVVALAGGLLWLGWGLAAAPVQPEPAAVFATMPTKAERVYRAMGAALSLYDVEQAAGGPGRVIRSGDPHTLLLSYDYPPQSVRVLLSREDAANGDYHVQSVALYQGKTLLQRHIEQE